MIDENLLLAHNIYSNKGCYAILLGSGVSHASGIPTGWEILIQLIERLMLLEKEQTEQDPEEWYTKKYTAVPGYSQIIEKLTFTTEERVNLLKPFFEPNDDTVEGLKQPALAHKAIAKLVQKGYIRVIVTTNFDRLMENALREIGIEATVISNPNHIDNVMPLIHSPITIVKINGDYLDTMFLNIETELSSYDNRLTEYLHMIFENFGLITCGWSGKWDIALNQIIVTSNKFRFGSYFTYIDAAENLQNIASVRHGKLIQIKDANFFFKELTENIEALETGQKIFPLSKPIAIARLKKYIEKPDQRIPLFDLITNELENTFSSINNYALAKPDEKAIKEAIEFYVNKLDLILTLSTYGIYWGENYHHNVWVKVITKFIHPYRDSKGWAVLEDLPYLPAIFLFYNEGLISLLKKDYSLLKKLFSITVNNPYREGEKINILKLINTDLVVDSKYLNAIFFAPQNKHVPHSELLYSHLKPYFKIWVSNDNEFEELFDTFELLYSLFFILNVSEEWFPLGRYIYRRRNHYNIIDSKYQELLQKKDQLDWIQADLFNDNNELLKAYSVFNERLKEIRII